VLQIGIETAGCLLTFISEVTSTGNKKTQQICNMLPKINQMPIAIFREILVSISCGSQSHD